MSALDREKVIRFRAEIEDARQVLSEMTSGAKVRVGRFRPLGEARQAVSGTIRAERFLPPPIPHLCL
jgi:hypothetical protein